MPGVLSTGARDQARRRGRGEWSPRPSPTPLLQAATSGCFWSPSLSSPKPTPAPQPCQLVLTSLFRPGSPRPCPASPRPKPGHSAERAVGAGRAAAPRLPSRPRKPARVRLGQRDPGAGLN